MALEQEFRVPLYSQEKSMRRMFDGLNDSIRCECTGHKVRPDSFHRLMMGTVHLHVRPPYDSPEQTPGQNRDAMGYASCWRALPMPEGVTHLGGNVLIEAASTGDVHRLHASANAQRGDFVA